MFERNPVDNWNAVTIAVEVTLDDGRTVVGRGALDRGKSVHKLLDGDDGFFYVETFDGDADFIPKSAIKRLKIIKPVEPRVLMQPGHAEDPMEPARVLDVSDDAPWDEVHASYRRLAKLYHPDRYAGIELPPEVADYIQAKAKRINQAFRLMKAARSAR